MAEFPALPIWTDALLGDTMHLTPAQFGAYMRLLFTAWRRPNCDLPNDDAYLGRAAGDNKNWYRLKPVVMAFFDLGPHNVWTQKRLLATRQVTAQRVAGFSAGGRATALKNKERASAKHPENEVLGTDQALSQAGAKHSARHSATITITKKEIRDSSDRGVGAKKGSRWPTEAVVSQDWIDDAAKTRFDHDMPEIDLRVEATKFANYWSAKSGAGGTKLDWHKTWINWTLKSEGNRNGYGKPTKSDNELAGARAAAGYFLAQGRSDEGGEAGGDAVPGHPALPPV